MAKTKIKTKKAAAKRFKITATGKVKFKRTGLRHNLGGKSTTQKSPKRKPAYLDNGHAKLIYPCFPYGLK